jgi:hypothetical protein
MTIRPDLAKARQSLRERELDDVRIPRVLGGIVHLAHDPHDRNRASFTSGLEVEMPVDSEGLRYS